MEQHEKQGWFDKPGNTKKFFRAFYVLLAVLLLADFLVHKHAYFHWEESPGFNAAFGLVCFILMVLVAKLLRPLLKRDEDYYDR